MEILPPAIAELEALERQTAQRVVKKLRWLAENFDHLRPEALTGNLGGFLKLRIGDYRVIYQSVPEEKLLIVHAVGHRRDVYRDP